MTIKNKNKKSNQITTIYYIGKIILSFMFSMFLKTFLQEKIHPVWLSDNFLEFATEFDHFAF